MTTNRFILLGLAILAGTAVTGAQPLPRDGSRRDASSADSAPNDPYLMDLDSLANTKVTTASKFSEALSDAPSVISVVTKDELRRFGGITLVEILQRVAGLSVSTSQFSDRSMIASRGDQVSATGAHVLILINGRPQREIMEGGINTDMLESFPVNILEQIEVIKGPGSVLYGSEAFSGVINLITRKADGPEIHIRAGGGSEGAAMASAEILLEHGALSVVAAGQYHQVPKWATTVWSADPATGILSGQNANLRDDGAGGYLGIAYKGFRFMSSYTQSEKATFGFNSVGNVRWKRGFADFGYSLKATAKWRMTFNLDYTRTTFDIPEFPGFHRDSNQAVLEWTNFITFSDRDQLTFGTAYNHLQGEAIYFAVNPVLIASQGNRSAVAFYAQHEHRLKDNLKLVGGFQANKIGSIALNIVPRAGLVWSLAKPLTLKVLYGAAFRAPSINELLLNHPALKGNPNLSPEKVGTLDVQLSYRNKRSQASIGYFHSRLSDLIVHDFSTMPGHYDNLAVPATIQGVELETKYYFGRNWFFIGSILYQTNQGSTAKPALTPIPGTGAKAGISYQTQSGADVSLFDAYQGHLPGYAAAPNVRPEAFHAVNAHARFDLSKHWLRDDARGFAVFVHADNLTNRQVWLPAWGTGLADTIPFKQGRTIYFGIEVWRKHE